METTGQDDIDRYKRRVKLARKHYEQLWAAAVTREGKQRARYDKELGDIRDLMMLARRQLEELGREDDVDLARDRAGLERSVDELEQVLANAEHRLHIAPGRARDAQPQRPLR